MQEKMFRAVRIERGSQGWGGPLVIQPTAEKDKIVAVTGGSIPDVAQRIADLTGAEVVSADTCRYVLVVMTTAGLYETSGDWLYDVGLPGKSGIGGGMITISPGKGALGTFAPPLDEAGNSVRGQLAARFLSRRLGLDLFASTPAVPVG